MAAVLGEPTEEHNRYLRLQRRKCQQRSSIRQFDTALPLPLSLTNSRAAHYKLPCDTLWMTLDWKSRLKSGRGEEA